MNSVEDKQQKSKFPKLYKFLKETYLLNQDSESHSFIELTQIFSIPIFYRILFMFIIIKALLISGFFIFTQNERSNWISTLVILELTISFLSTQQQSILQIKNKKFKKFIDKTILEKILKFSFSIIFCLEQNYTTYHYDCQMFNLNPGYIYFIIYFIYFFELKSAKRFNEYLFYSYILNLVFFISFCSLRNFMNFFLPINLVLLMFILLNLISQNYNKKLTKMMIYHKFFENLVKTIFKINKNDISVVYESNKQNGDEYQENLLKNGKSIERFGFDSTFELSKKRQNEDFQKVSIDEFNGFGFIYKNSASENKFRYFSKLFFYLKSPCKIEKTVEEELFMSDLENIYKQAKPFLKSSKFKILFEKILEENSFGLKEKIASLLLALCIEESCENFKILGDEFINEICNADRNVSIYQYYFSVNEKTEKCLASTIAIIKDLSNCLNFTIATAEANMNPNDKKFMIEIIFSRN